MIDGVNRDGFLSSRRRQIRPLLRALLALAGVVLTGTIGLRIIEGWDLWHSFFFTLITITTVGYGDEGISQSGRVFTALLLIVGIGVASYSFAVIVQSAVTAELSWRRRMKKRIDGLRNHTIICGFGRMGRIISEQLASVQEPFVIVEQTEQGFRRAYELGYAVVEGSATEDESLLRAGIQHAKHLVAAVDSESENIVITLTARELNPDVIIVARAEHDADVAKLRRAGATRVVAPFQSGGLEIANAILRPHVGDGQLIIGSQSGLTLTEILVDEGSYLEGLPPCEYMNTEGAHVLFIGLLRPKEELRVPPASSEPILAGDIVIVAGNPVGVARIREHACANSL
jgi:voltage-gated potassium channel